LHGARARGHADADERAAGRLSAAGDSAAGRRRVVWASYVGGTVSDPRAASPLIIAHRGASAHTAGNSLEAFEKAIAAGADGIEFDVRRTRDGELIVFHDARVGGVPVSMLSREEIAGRRRRRPALLREVLELAQGRVRLDVELKEAGYVERVLALVSERFTPPEVIVTSFLDPVVAEVKRIDPEIRTGLLLGVERPSQRLRAGRAELRPVARARACGADYLAPHHALARLGTLARADAAGLPALVWTVNRAEPLRELIADPRVAGIITNVPARALALRDSAQAPGGSP
jgi:glycerophosphoryl diester phosphodiesterase